MTFKLASDSAKLARARTFGKALGRAIKAAGVSEHQTALAAGISRSALRQYRAGYNLPALKTGLALATALDADGLAVLIRECRTEACATCDAPFVNEGNPARYCGDRCRVVAGKARVGVDTRNRADNAEKRLSGAREELAMVRAAVTAMCLDCEPEGACRAATCPLRPVSPLPLVGESAAAIARPAPGPWGSPANREATLAGIRAGNAARWDRPGERDAQAARAKAFHQGLTAEERAEHVRKISQGRAS